MDPLWCITNGYKKGVTLVSIDALFLSGGKDLPYELLDTINVYYFTSPIILG